MTVGEVVREYFPSASPREIEAILYGKTGWPAFLSDGEVSLRQQLSKYARAVKLGRDVCYCCGKIRFKKQLPDGIMCKRGLEVIRKSIETK